MSYERQYHKIVAELTRRRESGKVIAEAPRGSLAFCSALLSYQGRNVRWTILLLAIHVIEILTLAAVHYIYFPPVSLQILRITSALGMSALVAAIALRAIESRFNSALNSEIVRHPTQTLIIARNIFLGGAFLSAFLTLFLTFGTTLHFSSPAIYRAVLFGGVLGLPFELLLSFLLYQRSQFRRPPPLLAIRSTIAATLILSLGCIVFAAPLLYLICALTPRMWFALKLWKWASQGTGVNLFGKDSLPDATGVMHKTAAQFMLEICKPLSLLLAIELSVLFTFYPFTRGDPNFALLLFLLHKTLHIAQAFCSRFLLRFTRSIGIAYALQHAPVKQNLARKLTTATSLALVFSLVCIPLVFLQRQALFWISASGEEFVMDSSILVTLVVWLCAHVYATQRILLGAIAALSWKATLARVVCISIPLITSLCFVKSLQSYADYRMLFPLVALAEVLPQLIIAALPIRSGRILRRPEEFLHQRTSTEILESLVSVYPMRSLLFVRFVRNSSPAVALARYSLPYPFAVWGKESVAVVVPSEEVQDCMEQLISLWGAAIRHIHPLSAPTFLAKRLPQLERFEGPIDSQLMALALGRDGRKSIISMTARRYYKNLLVALDGISNAAPTRPTGVEVSHLIDGALSSTTCSPETETIHSKFARYLLESGETLDPWMWHHGAFAGIFHINVAPSHTAIFSIPIGHRAILSELRSLAFRYNFREVRQRLQNIFAASAAHQSNSVKYADLRRIRSGHP